MPQFAYSAINAQGAELDRRDPGAGPVRRARRAARQRRLLAQWIAEIKAPGADEDVERGFFEKKVEAEVAAGVLAAVRDDDRGRPLGRDGTRDPRAADRRPGARQGDRRRPRAGRDGRAPVRGDGEASGGLQPPLRRDGRGRRGRRRARHRARPRRDPDREGAEDQAPRQGRDDLPDGRAHVRVARDDGNADVPRPDLRQDLRPARRRAADADPVRPARVERTALPLSWYIPSPASCSSRRPIGGFFGFRRWKKTEAGRREVGPVQAAHPDADRHRRAEGRDGTLVAHALDADRVGRRHHARARDHRPDRGQLGRRGRDHEPAASASRKAPRSRSR